MITFYSNGIFTVDDGPARKVEDAANFSFIDSISKARARLPLVLHPAGMAGVHGAHPSHASQFWCPCP